MAMNLLFSHSMAIPGKRQRADIFEKKKKRGFRSETRVFVRPVRA